MRALFFRAAYNLPVTLGVARGLYARHGLDLEIAYTRGSTMVTEGLLSGRYDLGVLSADDIVYEVETHGADLFMFMGLHAGILTLVARPGIATLRDVAGKRLGVDDPASGFALVAHKILQTSGVTRDAYETVSAGGHEHRARALLDGGIDVALLTPPFTLSALARGCTALARARDHLPAYQASCGVATRGWARAHDATLVAYISAYRESLAFALDPAHRAEAASHLAAEFGRDDVRRARRSPRRALPRRADRYRRGSDGARSESRSGPPPRDPAGPHALSRPRLLPTVIARGEPLRQQAACPR
jgi:ABC-type nitrate/sulfonate/bicarbonate transport system substrate-binding protein